MGNDSSVRGPMRAETCSSGVVGVGLSHEHLWLPQPEHALMLTAWVDLLQITFGVLFISLIG